MYSKMQHACRTLGNGLYDFVPSLFMTITSPGSMSRMYFASMRSSAQVSEARTYEPSRIPRQSGLKPCGSLTPIISFSVSMISEYEPWMRLSDEVYYQLAVYGGVKYGAVCFEFVLDRAVVGEVPVMRHRDGAKCVVDKYRLDVVQDLARAGGGVSVVAYRARPLELPYAFLAEYVGHEAQAPLLDELPAFGGDNARAFLAPVLQGVQAKVYKVRRLG